MGNFRFRLSKYVMPKSWFYKLKDKRKLKLSKKQTIQHPSIRTLHRHSTKDRSNSSSSSTTLRQPNQLPVADPRRHSYYFSTNKQLNTSPSVPNSSFSNCFDDTLAMQHLPRIITKPTRKEVQIKGEFDGKRIMLYRAQQGLGRIKVKPSTPEIELKKFQVQKWRRVVNCQKLLESFVVIKKTSNPHKEFKESMVDMIVENCIWNLKDMEELLGCYLALNSDNYHVLIVKVFEEIWNDITCMEVS